MRVMGVVVAVQSRKMTVVIEVYDRIVPVLGLLEGRCPFGCSMLRQMGNVVLRTP